ncbi:hypothetical protein EPA93_46270 [Ktedonosporobacter rubrisoli]|uniref:Uncharacterized protein n=1 Tax=Ktedonosporobacter rubrisoli TaxID=2509675 RepID=A0A4P6K443_KTERU|nr:hypothetical protein [Ktedonosporobacter rubrisoli]QBD82979.1 hypothetical protein EPA93_46270 [Ktedonosporobacter rubrisoli]
MPIDDISDSFDSNSHKQRERPLNEDRAMAEKDSLWPYIGDWKALQNGTAQRALLRELIERGSQPRIGQSLPPEDPLARYKCIPLHARLLYTSMDPFIESIILKHYATIDGLSHDRCDIYLSIEQFNNPGETLDYLENSPVLKKSGVQIRYDDLPGIFFWDHQWVGEFISFRSCVSESAVNIILRCIFQEIREEPTIAAVRRAKKLLL